MFRRVTKTLTCPACGVIIAEATYRPWPGDLTLRTPENSRLQPLSGAVQVRLAESQVGEATSAGDRATAEARLRFLRGNIGELMFDLRCRNGHSTLQTMPQIVRALRKTPGRWVALKA